MIQSEWPGSELVERGISDLERGVVSIEALLVSVSAPRLRALGLSVPEPLPEPEIRLYRLLSTEHGSGAHARYNSLVRRIVSFQRAMACAK